MKESASLSDLVLRRPVSARLGRFVIAQPNLPMVESKHHRSLLNIAPLFDS